MHNLNKKNILKIGILGGSFDPPHNGHLAISKIALKKFKLKKIIWIVAQQNPFKSKPKFSLKTRINLSKKILRKQNKIIVKNLNKKLNTKNTYKMINFLKNKRKKTQLFFLMGADNLINFHKWHNWKKIPKLAKIIVFARPNFSSRVTRSFATKKLGKKDWFYVSSTKLNVSSSKLKSLTNNKKNFVSKKYHSS